MSPKNFCCDCGKEILPESKRCRHCSRLEAERIKRIKREANRVRNFCPGCGKEITKPAKTCMACSRLNKDKYLKISKALKGKYTGKIVSSETRKKLSEAGKGRIFSPETRNKISIKAKAKNKEIRSDEHIRKLVQANLDNGSFYQTGTIKSQGDYDYIKISHLNGQRNWYPLHRYLIEKEIGRQLKRTEHVHHIDGNTHNNNLDNLVLLTGAQHNKLNYFLGLIGETERATQEKIAKTIKIRFPSLF